MTTTNSIYKKPTTAEILAKIKEAQDRLRARSPLHPAPLTATQVAVKLALPDYPTEEVWQQAWQEWLHELLLAEPEKFGNRVDLDADASNFTWNDQQQAFITIGLTGKSLNLIGPAGTGKTTTQKEFVRRMIKERKVPALHTGTKYLTAGSPGIAIIAYTRRAVANIKRAMPAAIKDNCITIHKLLEYEPVFYEEADETGTLKNKMRFIPTRTRYNPLPVTLRTIIIEEASMVSVELFSLIIDALPKVDQVQFVFLGDIQQLPPIYGSAILGYKLLELQTVELTHVYRQALESPIIRLAHHFLKGETVPTVFRDETDAELEFRRRVTKTPAAPRIRRSDVPAEWKEDPKLLIRYWQKPLSPDDALHTAALMMTTALDGGEYDPANDMILLPYNVEFGTIELNKHIAQHLNKKRGTPVWEVIAGFNKHYLSVGDKVMYDKEDAVITKITRNGNYIGKAAMKSSLTLDRWGCEHGKDVKQQQDAPSSLDIDRLLDLAASSNEDRTLDASHTVELKMAADESIVVLDKSKEINDLLLGYVLTVHKAQGCEWGKVFLILHALHSKMVSRELLYTAVTRAREQLIILCEPERNGKGGSLINGVYSQRIKGNTLAEKAEFFKGKLKEGDMFSDSPGGKKLGNIFTAREEDIVPDSLFAAQYRFCESKRAELEAKIRQCLAIATAKEPNASRLARIPLKFGVTGEAAGTAALLTQEICLNPVHTTQRYDEQLNDTIPHEVAHIVANVCYGSLSHDSIWEKVMEWFGLDGKASKYHTMGMAADIIKQQTNDNGALK